MAEQSVETAAICEALRERLCGFEDDGERTVRVELLGSLDEIAQAVYEVICLPSPTGQADRP